MPNELACGNTPVLTRRAALTGSFAAACTLPAAATLARDQGESRILALFREHQALVDAGEAHVCLEEDMDSELDRLFFNRASKIEDEMMTLPSTSAADFAAKLVVATGDGGCDLDARTHPLWREVRELTGRSVGPIGRGIA